MFVLCSCCSAVSRSDSGTAAIMATSIDPSAPQQLRNRGARHDDMAIRQEETQVPEQPAGPSQPGFDVIENILKQTPYKPMSRWDTLFMRIC